MSYTEELRQRIRTQAEREFQGHVIKELHSSGVYRSWRCGKPGDSNCHFVITTWPGTLCVTGDLGCVVVQRVYDMVPWCRGSASRDLSYFLEKVPQEFTREEYDPECFAQWAKDWLEEHPEISPPEDEGDSFDEAEMRERIGQRATVEDLLHRYDDISTDELYGELIEAGLVDGGDLPDFRRPTARMLWLWECVRWFVANYDGPVIEEPEKVRA